MWTNSYRTLPSLFYESALPSATIQPTCLLWNESLQRALQLDETWRTEEGIQILSGVVHQREHEPLAMAYMGHQFGQLTMLGDGRAILLGEWEVDGTRFDVQLKGSGPTPFSRGGDGFAALGPMLREYVMSEALHALQIPTTRSLAVIETGRSIQREVERRGALVVRTASSHIRVGTFQYAYHYGTLEDVKALADYVIARHYPHVDHATNRYVSLFREVMKRQAQLVAKWQAVGFVHGVLNTDNVTVSGETIDYGPCAFIDHYDPSLVFSSIDRQGRYAYQRQPIITGWNIARFAETLLPLFGDASERVAIAQREMNAYGPMYESYWLREMRSKIGVREEDDALLDRLFVIMRTERRDWTETFRALTIQDEEALQLDTSDAMREWYTTWQRQIAPYEEEAKRTMRRVNPAFIPRQYLVDRAIEQWDMIDDRTSFDELLQLIRQPYAYTEEQLAYTFPPEERGRISRTYCGT